MIALMSCIRLIHCKLVVSKNLMQNSANLQLIIFFFLTLLMGLVWTSIYFISTPYVAQQQLYGIILVFGGMTAGATTTLAIYFPSFIAYIFSIFLPVIIYNFCFLEFDPSILSIMIMFFLLAIILTARSLQDLLKRTFLLTEQNKSLTDKFEMLSITDALTGLYNRRHFTKVMQEEYNRAKRNQQSFALVSIDVDNFKLINDSLGHPFGDKFLTYIADYLKNYLRRSNDIIFRLGGDEFSALLLNSTEEKAKQICDEIKSRFLKNPKFDQGSQDGTQQQILKQISLSIGVVYVPHDSTANIEQIIEKVDQSLYKSKNDGKNQINYTKCV